MSTPVRKEIEKIIALAPSPDTAKLREVVEWFKMARNQNYIMDGGLNPLELERIDAAWGTLVTTVSNREAVPAGFLSYMLATLADQEAALVGTAIAEATEVVSEAEEIAALTEFVKAQEESNTNGEEEQE